MQILSNRPVQTEVLLRALAIAAIVYNHSHPIRPFDYAGGMTVLMLISGITFARLNRQSADPQTLRIAILRFVLKIWIACAIIILMSFAVRGAFDPLEIMFVSNWISSDHLAFMFVWYPQVLTQVMIAIYVLSFLPGVKGLLVNPLSTSYLCLVIAILLAVVWPDEQLYLPQEYAWNFVLGWVVYFGVMDPRQTTGTMQKVVISCITAACALAIEGPVSLSTWALVGAVGGLTFVKQMRLARPLANVVFIVSQAMFVIFLLHVVLLRVYTVVLGFENQEGAWLFTMVTGSLLWVIMAASLRVYGRSDLKWRHRRMGNGRRGASNKSFRSALMPGAAGGDSAH